LFGYNTFIWSCARLFNKKDFIYSLIKYREKYFINILGKEIINKVHSISFKLTAPNEKNI